ncbi:MAG: ADP-ribosylation factor-like protein [Myxococcales bacterium]|nr:ADP-ribosylation factor-like protein [Myxococcales bacterium]MDH5567950.1 ADP-ribosylation factor-like protein [Myxococcales bacterium]
MAKISAESTEVNARIVYWGVEGAGKKTSLRKVVTKLRPDHRGEMRSIATPLDPSVSYTVLPIELGEIGGVRTRIEMLAVPGAAEQAPTRKQLLDQVDGIVFVVDSQRERIAENVASLDELRKALADYARSIEQIPLVIQYNKRDLSDPYVLEELHRRLAVGNATVFEAVATEGTGLLQTLSTISKKVIRALREQRIEPNKEEAPAYEPAPAVQAPEFPSTRVEAPAPLAAPLPAATMEEAILAEPDHPDAGQIEAAAFATEAVLDEPWHDTGDVLEETLGARIDETLSIVSVGEAVRADARSIRIPLVLGDADGQTSTVVLTIRLDPLISEAPD